MYHNGSVFNHTGLVIAVSGNSYTTIEGNTNDGSGVVAEGIGVYQRNATKQGVKKFQTSKGLTADGIAGRDTFAKLAGV